MSTPRLRIMGKTVGSTHERRESFDVSSPISLTVGGGKDDPQLSMDVHLSWSEEYGIPSSSDSVPLRRSL